ncbi:MAG TPA: hypothetical protein VET45_18035, partial [Candidatus Binatia bacterium]|nr:hypothetical protein [Candidatus Binatia bacterium]
MASIRPDGKKSWEAILSSLASSALTRAGLKILRTEPTVPHDRLGEIVVDASTDPAPPVVEIERSAHTSWGRTGAEPS